MKTIGKICKRGELVIEWSIERFFFLSVKENVYYDSPLFSYANVNWSLWISPNEKRDDNTDGSISLYLHRDSSGPPIRMAYTLGVKTVDGKLDLENHFTYVFEEIDGFGTHDLLSRTQLFRKKSQLLPSDVLTLVCRINCPTFTKSKSSSNVATTNCFYCNKTLEAEEDIFSHLRKCQESVIECQKCSNQVVVKNLYDHKCFITEAEGKECSLESTKNILQNKVLQDYKELFLKKQECDVIIKVKEQEFSAHRTILAARSCVFESTFRNNMKEKETGIVDIEDCDPSSFSDFLCFLYCGEIETLSEANVFSLFTTADKYDVQDLKDICVKFMKENISVDTFCDTISLALLHCENELITLATDFFTKNARKMFKTVQWLRFSAAHPTQSNELVIKAFDAAAGTNE